MEYDLNFKTFFTHQQKSRTWDVRNETTSLGRVKSDHDDKIRGK